MEYHFRSSQEPLKLSSRQSDPLLESLESHFHRQRKRLRSPFRRGNLIALWASSKEGLLCLLVYQVILLGWYLTQKLFFHKARKGKLVFFQKYPFQERLRQSHS